MSLESKKQKHKEQWMHIVHFKTKNALERACHSSLVGNDSDDIAKVTCRACRRHFKKGRTHYITRMKTIGGIK